jgi:hypothetical protein
MEFADEDWGGEDLRGDVRNNMMEENTTGKEN